MRSSHLPPTPCQPAPAEAGIQGDQHNSGQGAAISTVSPDEPERVIRGCLHLQVHHEHGTRTAYVRDRCRCPACTTANRLEAQQRRKAIAYGRWQGLVPAEGAREQVQHLRAVGLSLQRIATLSGVGYGTLARLIYGDPSRHQPPTARLRHDTHQRLLNLSTDTAAGSVPSGTRVTATGSRRRLQALVAAGWPLPALAQRLGRSPGNLRRTMTAHSVTAGSAGRITTLYDSLRDKPPPIRTPLERDDAADARNHAARSGWLPPWAWDDIDHDSDDQARGSDHGSDLETCLDEIAIEQAMQGNSVPLTRPERDEAIARLTNRGISARHIASLLETSSRNVVRRRAAHRAA